MRRGCVPPPPTTAFRRAADEGAGKTSKRVGHGAGKVRRMGSWAEGAWCTQCNVLFAAVDVYQVSAALLRQVIFTHPPLSAAVNEAANSFNIFPEPVQSPPL